MWELDYKERWEPKNWCFWTVVLDKTLESPLDCKEIQPVHPKGDQSWVFIGRADVEAETRILRPPDAKSWLIWKDLDAGKDWGQEKGMTEDEMVGWHHQLNGHEFEWTPGAGDGQGGLACCSPWGHKESDATEQLNWTDELYLNKVVKNKPICFYSEYKCLHLRLFIPTIDKYVIKTSLITIVTTIGAQFYLKMAFETSISSTNPLQENSLPAEPPGKPNVGRHHPNLMRATIE